jgi:hypothetical protein
VRWSSYTWIRPVQAIAAELGLAEAMVCQRKALGLIDRRVKQKILDERAWRAGCG